MGYGTPSVNLTWGGLALAMSKAGGKTDPTTTVATTAENCTTSGDYAVLKTLPAATVLSGINQGAPILNFTHHRVIAAPYHRNLGNLVAYEAFLGDAAKARQLLVDNGVSLVAICRAVDENPDASPDTLHGRLMRGDPPAWLHMVPTSKDAAIEIYEVMPTTG